MMVSSLYDRYLLKNLFAGLLITACVLTAIIFLTQSLKFLELIIESGASSATFWLLAVLALPRFFEVILPIALMITVIFIYNRMNSDSELVVFRSIGKSPMTLARPALILGLITTFLLLFISMWLSPKTLASMNKMRGLVKDQYTTLIFREGVFNTFGDDITVFIQNKNSAGEMEGLLIHDSRPENEVPNTVMAKRGVIVKTDDGQRVLVYNGSKQDINPKTGALNRLDFDRYTIDLPNNESTRAFYKDADERTFWELLHPDLTKREDINRQKQFEVEAHRRVIGPFLALSFAAISLCFLILGATNRRGGSGRIFFAVLSVILLQSLYLALFNYALVSNIGLALLYCVVFLPLSFCLFMLSRAGESLRISLFSLLNRWGLDE
ncbi:MAG: LPS export ABC transporter permease LptF [Pseudomonadota bacterium]